MASVLRLKYCSICRCHRDGNQRRSESTRLCGNTGGGLLKRHGGPRPDDNGALPGSFRCTPFPRSRPGPDRRLHAQKTRIRRWLRQQVDLLPPLAPVVFIAIGQMHSRQKLPAPTALHAFNGLGNMKNRLPGQHATNLNLHGQQSLGRHLPAVHIWFGGMQADGSQTEPTRRRNRPPTPSVIGSRRRRPSVWLRTLDYRDVPSPKA